MTFDLFCNVWLQELIGFGGHPSSLDLKREDLKERRQAATDAELLALAKMEKVLDAVDFCGVQRGPVQVDLPAWLRGCIPGWRAVHLEEDEFELVETVYTTEPVAYMLLSEPLCEESLKLFARAAPGQVRSLFFAVAPSSTWVWVSLLEIIAGWNSLESIGLSDPFFGSDTGLEFVRLLVDRLEVKQLVLCGPVVHAVGPDFFKDARVREFVFPQTVRYEPNGVFFPLLGDCSLEQVRAFFENLPAQKVVLRAEDWDWDGSLPLSDDLLVAAVDALRCAEVVLDGVKGVGSNRELLRLLFGAEKFTSIGIFGEHLVLSIDRDAMWQQIATNSALRCFEVDFLTEFPRAVLQASSSICVFGFSKLGCSDPTFYESDLLQSEVVSVHCRSFDPHALALCASLEKETELAERRARCLLSCCLQLAPEAHNHIVPSVGAVPVPVMQYAVEHAGKLRGEAEEKGATSRPGKRKLGGDQV